MNFLEEMGEKIKKFKNNEELEGYLEERFPETPLITYPNLFEAYVGVVEGKGLEPKVCYDYDESVRLIAKQISDQGEFDDESLEAAIEYFEFNTLGAYYGEHTPVFLHGDMEI